MSTLAVGLSDEWHPDTYLQYVDNMPIWMLLYCFMRGVLTATIMQRSVRWALALVSFHGVVHPLLILVLRLPMPAMELVASMAPDANITAANATAPVLSTMATDQWLGISIPILCCKWYLTRSGPGVLGCGAKHLVEKLQRGPAGGAPPARKERAGTVA